VITLPLVLLAIPSVVIGAFTIGPMLFGDVFKGVIFVDPQHGAMAELAKHFHGAGALALHALQTLPFWLAISGVAAAYYCYLVNPALPEAIGRRCAAIHRVLENKYYLDRFNEIVFAGGARRLGSGLWKVGDQTIAQKLGLPLGEYAAMAGYGEYAAMAGHGMGEYAAMAGGTAYSGERGIFSGLDDADPVLSGTDDEDEVDMVETLADEGVNVDEGSLNGSIFD
jgi:NADH:ubiquinone oxidoreductase subunit 5 (subunit L)/multisubunit Na+/H+ antiporter MnhA subunit